MPKARFATEIGRLKGRLFDAIAPNVEGGVVTFAAVPLCASATK